MKVRVSRLRLVNLQEVMPVSERVEGIRDFSGMPEGVIVEIPAAGTAPMMRVRSSAFRNQGKGKFRVRG